MQLLNMFSILGFSDLYNLQGGMVAYLHRSSLMVKKETDVNVSVIGL